MAKLDSLEFRAYCRALNIPEITELDAYVMLGLFAAAEDPEWAKKVVDGFAGDMPEAERVFREPVRKALDFAQGIAKAFKTLGDEPEWAV